MKIQILGSGCPSCQTLEANAKAAVTTAGLEAEVEKVTDMDAITEMGVMLTPALVIDGVVKTSGKVLNVEEILTIVQGE